MLDSVKISRRQSEIRQTLAELVGKEQPSEDETRQMDTLDKEYRTNESRFRAALVAEDEERRDAKDELERRGGDEWRDLIGRFEVRQIALALDEGRTLDGATAEVVQELRGRGGYRGMPVPWEALETRTGETIASGTPDPITTRPIIDRIFAQSVAARMGAQMINIDAGETEYPVTTSSVSTGWQSSETGAVGSAAAYQTTDRPLAPDHTLGVQMKITRKTLKQSGRALEQAVRRDMNGAIAQAMDAAVFQGSGGSGQPTGIFAGASGLGITETAINAAPTWATFRAAVVRFMTANAITSPGEVRVLIRPENWDDLEGALYDSGSGMTEWDRMLKNIPASNVVISANAVAAPAGSPLANKALLTTTVNGVPPIFVGAWGAVDMIRDPFSDAASGGLRLTGLATMDVTVSRTAQLEVLTAIQGA